MFKVRCSAIGKIMTSPRAKSEVLSETCKGYLKEWYIEDTFNRHKDLKNQYVQKGLQTEEAGLTLLTLTQKLGMVKKNEEKFENDFCTGTPDLIHNEIIYDIKSSFDIFTFPYFDTECPSEIYYWQMQGYMWLTGLQSAKLCYVLVDLPEVLQYDLAKKISYDSGFSGEITEEIEESVRTENTYSDIEQGKRIRIFEIERNNIDIARIENKVKECRKFLEEIV